MKNEKTFTSESAGKLKRLLTARISVTIVLTVTAVCIVFILTESPAAGAAAAAAAVILSTVAVYMALKPLRKLKNTIKFHEDFQRGIYSFCNTLDKASKTGNIKSNGDDITRQIAEVFNHLMDSFKEFLEEMDRISDETLNTSRYLASSTESTSTTMENITGALDDFSSVTDRLNSTWTKVTENAQKVDRLAREGMQKINELETMMTEIRNESEKASEQIIELNDAASHIESILKLISEIADSTNMLALNASIEAARAGEGGKGFTVVAGEIRKLAQNTQSSLKDIRTVVISLKERIDNAVDTISKNDARVRKCEDVMKHTSGMFGSIAGDISLMKESISLTSEVSRDISGSREEIAASAQQQITSVRKLDETARHLSTVASRLKEKLADTDIGGTKIEIDLDSYDKRLVSVSDDQKRNIITQLGLEGRFVISVIARLEEAKGHKFLFSALGQVVSQNKNIICLVVGDGSLEDELKTIVKSEGLEHNTRFLGFRKDIPLLLSVSDAAVLTSRKEGMPPRILLEAMALSRPVIATDLHSIRKVVIHEKTGFLVEYGKTEELADSIMALASSMEKCRAFGRAGRSHIEELAVKA